jgi:hypothetical protein
MQVTSWTHAEDHVVSRIYIVRCVCVAERLAQTMKHTKTRFNEIMLQLSYFIPNVIFT